MTITNPTVVTVTESVTDITVTGQEEISVDITMLQVRYSAINFRRFTELKSSHAH